MTQRELAEQLGIDSMLVSKWERGAHKPSDGNLAALSHIFGRDIAWFYVDRAEVVA